MKSLAERKKYREKQRAKERRDEETSPTVAASGNGDNSSEDSDEFDAADWLADSVPNIEAAIGDLTDEQLDQIEESEKAGKGRSGVTNAISQERAKRSAKTGSWSTNAG